MRKPIRGIGFIIGGLLLAIIAGVMASQIFAKTMQETKVVVAIRDIQPYTQITPTDVEVRTLPASAVPEESASSLQQVVGKFTKAAILEGNPVQKDHLSLEGNDDLGSVLTSIGDSDIRAFALPSQNPLIQKIQPGNLVDLHATVKEEEGDKVISVAENVLVLGWAGSSTKEEPKGLILALTKDQISQLLPVMNNVQISLLPFNAKGGELYEYAGAATSAE